MEEKKSAAQMATPPFPDKMTFREMLTNLFNTDFLSGEELKIICDAGEMYANGCLKLAAPGDKGGEEAAEKGLVEISEELWDEFSELLSTDIDYLSGFTGREIITEHNYKKLIEKLGKKI